MFKKKYGYMQSIFASLVGATMSHKKLCDTVTPTVAGV